MKRTPQPATSLTSHGMRCLGGLAMVTACCQLLACGAGPPAMPAPAPVADASADAGDSIVRPTEVAFDFAPSDLLAKRLAAFLWDSDVTDPSLVARLQAPLTAARVTQVAEEMLADPRAEAGTRAFFRWWLLLDALETLDKVDPEAVLDRELRLAMMEEAPYLGAHLTLASRGTYQDLLTGPFTFVNERLARHYQMADVSGTHFRKVAYPSGQSRVGLLTGAGLLTLFASLASPSWPAKRSWLVTDQILCTVPIRTFLPTPPLDPGRSIRQQMLDVTKDQACRPCHDILNSPGFAFIGFDSFGRWRPEAAHGPGETEGWIPAQVLPDAPRFNGPAELATLLAAREQSTRCLTRFWLQFAVDREMPGIGELSEAMKRSLEVAHHDFARSGFVLRELPLAIVRTASFAGQP